MGFCHCNRKATKTYTIYPTCTYIYLYVHIHTHTPHRLTHTHMSLYVHIYTHIQIYMTKNMFYCGGSGNDNISRTYKELSVHHVSLAPILSLRKLSLETYMKAAW